MACRLAGSWWSLQHVGLLLTVTVVGQRDVRGKHIGRRGGAPRKMTRRGARWEHGRGWWCSSGGGAGRLSRFVILVGFGLFLGLERLLARLYRGKQDSRQSVTRKGIAQHVGPAYADVVDESLNVHGSHGIWRGGSTGAIAHASERMIQSRLKKLEYIAKCFSLAGKVC